MATKYLAVCNCGNVIETTKPRSQTCRCGNHIPREYFEKKSEKRYVTITGFRGEKIKCYQK